MKPEYTAGVNERDTASPTTWRVVSEEVRLAQEFLATLENLRAPWAELFEGWAAKRGLSPALTYSTKVAILKIRTFGAVERSPRRRRP